MSLSTSNQQGNQNPPAKDPITLTMDKIIKAECSSLQSIIGDLTQAEENRRGLRKIYQVRKCSFIETEYNYQLYRNLELNTGVELVQATTEIKQNVATYIKLSDTLAASLRTVIANVKDAKKKFGDLRQAATDLKFCLHDQCNCSQKEILTGKPPAINDDKYKKGQGQPPPQVHHPAVCPEAAHILRNLVDMPKYFLADSDTLLFSAADVSGIQTFVNIKSIDQLQMEFSTAAKAFETQVQTKMNQGLTELTQLQKDLTKAATDLTTAGHAVYNKRDEADACTETIEYLCERPCDCIIDTNENGEDVYEHRFDNCKAEICRICGNLDNHYCQREPPQDDQQKNY